MDAQVYHEEDCDPSIIKKMKVAVIGFGSQGHAHAQNLQDSGAEVVAGLREDSSSRDHAGTVGIKVMTPVEAARWADVVMMLVPDEICADIYKKEIEPEMKPGKALAFAHGFNIHYGKIVPPEGVDVFMVAPKSPGPKVRLSYMNDQGVPMLIAVAQDASGQAKETAMSYAWGIGGARAGLLETTFQIETETDLFGEQHVLCGGTVQLVMTGFDVLVEAGYPPEAAYFEVLHELELITSLMQQTGVGGMLGKISNTAKYGCLTVGPKLVDKRLKDRMRAGLDRIQDGSFAAEWMAEAEAGSPNLSAMMGQIAEHPIEKVGPELRGLFSW